MTPPRREPGPVLFTCVCLAAVAGLVCNPPPDADGAVGPSGWIDLMHEGHWRAFGSDGFPENWSLDEGVLAVVTPGGPDLVTRDSYGDFELMLEWKISPCGNSGIFYRGSEEEEYIWLTAPEMQVLDDTCHPDGLNAKWSAGAVYDLYAPAEDATRSVGEWNEVRILADGPHTELWLNGVRVAEYEQGSRDWNERVAGSKFHDWDGFGTHMSGPIGLQDHGDQVWYRHVRVRRLD